MYYLSLSNLSHVKFDKSSPLTHSVTQRKLIFIKYMWHSAWKGTQLLIFLFTNEFAPVWWKLMYIRLVTSIHRLMIWITCKINHDIIRCDFSHAGKDPCTFSSFQRPWFSLMWIYLARYIMKLHWQTQNKMKVKWCIFLLLKNGWSMMRPCFLL